MGLLSKIFGNTRKPEGFFGRLMVSGMNGRYAVLFGKLSQKEKEDTLARMATLIEEER